MNNVTNITAPSKLQVLPESLTALYIDEFLNIAVNIVKNKQVSPFVSFMDAAIVSSRISLPIITKMSLVENFVADDCNNQIFCVVKDSSSHIAMSMMSRAAGGYVSTKFFYGMIPQFAPISQASQAAFLNKISEGHDIKNAITGAAHGANSHVDYKLYFGEYEKYASFTASITLEIADNFIAAFLGTGDPMISMVLAGSITATSIYASGELCGNYKDIMSIVQNGYNNIISTMKGEVADLPMPKLVECHLGLINENCNNISYSGEALMSHDEL